MWIGGDGDEVLVRVDGVPGLPLQHQLHHARLVSLAGCFHGYPPLRLPTDQEVLQRQTDVHAVRLHHL